MKSYDKSSFSSEETNHQIINQILILLPLMSQYNWVKKLNFEDIH